MKVRGIDWLPNTKQIAKTPAFQPGRRKNFKLCLFCCSLVGYDELDVVNPESKEVETGAKVAEDDVRAPFSTAKFPLIHFLQTVFPCKSK